MSEEKQYPSLPEQGKNMAQFLWDIFKHTVKNHDSLFVSDEIAEKRIKICQQCEWYDATEHRCKECGCYLAPKVRFSLESCPIQSWSEDNNDWLNGGFDKLMEEIESKEDELT